MSKRFTRTPFVALCVVAIAALVGCSKRTQDKAEAAVEQTGAAAASAASDVANATEKAADAVAAGTAKAADAVAEGTEAAAKEVAGKIETMDVKKELLADARVDATNINVDTDGTAKTITLNGTVPKLAQKTIAAQIAAKQAPGYKIVNNLTVR